MTSDANWRQPVKWDREARESGVRKRVFCASLADVFDNEVDPSWRDRLWDLIRTTPHLDWLLLTKRVGNVSKMLPMTWGQGWPHVWLGISVVNQAEAYRDIPKLLSVPARIRFLSMEPLLGPVDLVRSHGVYRQVCCSSSLAPSASRAIDWVIVGGESGPHARPMHPDWVRDLRDQCQGAGVAFFFKQHGEWAPKINGHVADGSKEWGALAYSGTFSPLTTTWNGCQGDGPDREYTMIRVGKKASGRLLDGREWNQFPGARNAAA